MENRYWVQNRYSEKIVMPEVMHYAKTLDDIREQIQYVIVDNFSKDIFQQYLSDKGIVYLGFSRLIISGNAARIKAFHTANLFGVDYQQKINDTIFFRTHILHSRIKYLGKDLFGKTLDCLQSHGVSLVSITPLQSTGSLEFYKKMINVYADRILDAYVYSNDDISLLLRDNEK